MGRRIVAGSLAIATAVGLIVTGDLASAAPAPPPNPTNGQLNAARDAKQALANRVGQLSGQIAQAQNELAVLKGKSEQAEQKYALLRSQRDAAQVAANRAKADLARSNENVVSARAKFVQYIQASYMGGGVDGTAGSLLTADDPSALLEQSSLEEYQAQHHADAVGVLERALVAKSNDKARVDQTLQRLQKFTEEANAARQAAFAAVVQQRQREIALNASLAGSRHELDVAQEQLATLNNQRTVYLAYKAEQARLARIRAEKLRQQRLAAERARRAREQRGNGNGGGGGGGGSNGGGFSSGPSAPTGGGWSAAKGRRAVSRAMSQLGVPYAWAGGGVGGPSFGVCDGSNGAPNDCNVRGYDCSGLVLYAWGRYWDHYAATQFSQAGSYHPSLGNLQPGDLLFWSFNGSVSGIHHVAIYIGHGDIIQAPESGSYVMVSSMYSPGSIFGATRPLT